MEHPTFGVQRLLEQIPQPVTVQILRAAYSCPVSRATIAKPPQTKEQIKETSQQAFKATKKAKRERYILSREARLKVLKQIARKNRRRRIIQRVMALLRLY